MALLMFDLDRKRWEYHDLDTVAIHYDADNQKLLTTPQNSYRLVQVFTGNTDYDGSTPESKVFVDFIGEDRVIKKVVNQIYLSYTGSPTVSVINEQNALGGYAELSEGNYKTNINAIGEIITVAVKGFDKLREVAIKYVYRILRNKEG